MDSASQLPVADWFSLEAVKEGPLSRGTLSRFPRLVTLSSVGDEVPGPEFGRDKTSSLDSGEVCCSVETSLRSSTTNAGVAVGSVVAGTVCGDVWESSGMCALSLADIVAGCGVVAAGKVMFVVVNFVQCCVTMQIMISSHSCVSIVQFIIVVECT